MTNIFSIKIISVLENIAKIKGGKLFFFTDYTITFLGEELSMTWYFPLHFVWPQGDSPDCHNWGISVALSCIEIRFDAHTRTYIYIYINIYIYIYIYIFM